MSVPVGGSHAAPRTARSLDHAQAVLGLDSRASAADSGETNGRRDHRDHSNNIVINVHTPTRWRFVDSPLQSVDPSRAYMIYNK